MKDRWKQVEDAEASFSVPRIDMTLKCYKEVRQLYTPVFRQNCDNTDLLKELNKHYDTLSSSRDTARSIQNTYNWYFGSEDKTWHDDTMKEKLLAIEEDLQSIEDTYSEYKRSPGEKLPVPKLPSLDFGSPCLNVGMKDDDWIQTGNVGNDKEVPYSGQDWNTAALYSQIRIHRLRLYGGTSSGEHFTGMCATWKRYKQDDLDEECVGHKKHKTPVGWDVEYNKGKGAKIVKVTAKCTSAYIKRMEFFLGNGTSHSAGPDGGSGRKCKDKKDTVEIADNCVMVGLRGSDAEKGFGPVQFCFSEATWQKDGCDR